MFFKKHETCFLNYCKKNIKKMFFVTVMVLIQCQGVTDGQTYIVFYINNSNT